jgi:hypothetical protein
VPRHNMYVEPKLSGFSKKNPTRSAADCGM